MPLLRSIYSETISWPLFLNNMTKDQLQNYFYNTCSKQHANDVELWLANIKDDSSEDLLLKEVLNETKANKDEYLVKRAFGKFKRNTQSYKNKESKKNTIIQQLGFLYKVAAAVLLLPLIITAAYFYVEKNNPKEWIEEYVPYGQSKMICLSDSSKIWLNAGTKLIYPKKFNNSIRQVYLSGEAYAEISKDKTRPFVLSAGEVSVEVLGTKFNVKSYSEDSQIAVSLMEGAVRMNANYKGTLNTKLLKPGEIVKFTKSTGKLEKDQFAIPSRNQWYNGKGFYFIDESLAEITTLLERYFDVRINIENNSLKKERFYSVFVNNESLEEILSALNINGKMKIRHNANIIYINKNE